MDDTIEVIKHIEADLLVTDMYTRWDSEGRFEVALGRRADPSLARVPILLMFCEGCGRDAVREPGLFEALLPMPFRQKEILEAIRAMLR